MNLLSWPTPNVAFLVSSRKSKLLEEPIPKLGNVGR